MRQQADQCEIARPWRQKSRSIEAEKNHGTSKVQQLERNKADAKSGVRRARAPESGLLGGFRERKQKGIERIENGAAAERDENAETAVTRRGS